MTTGFFDATTARQVIVDGTTVTTEISLIQLNILASIANANVTTTITRSTNVSVSGSTITGTPMTTNAAYYIAWQNATNDPIKTAQMNEIITYFQYQGYGIARRSTDSVHMNWVINW